MRATFPAIAAAFAGIVAASALWVVNLRMGPRLEGFTGGPMVVLLPFGLIFITAAWLVLRSLFDFRWSLVTVFLASLALSFAAVAAYCGPIACFQPGPNRLMGWFLVGGVVLAALLHHVVLSRSSRGSENAR